MQIESTQSQRYYWFETFPANIMVLLTDLFYGIDDCNKNKLY